MGRLIDADEAIKDMQYYHDDCAKTSVYTRLGFETAMEVIKSAPPVEAILKADYETRLKADMVAMLTEIQLEIKELWDSRYDVWLDNQYYIGKSDTLEEVDDIIQQKINALKGVEDEND